MIRRTLNDIKALNSRLRGNGVEVGGGFRVGEDCIS